MERQVGKRRVTHKVAQPQAETRNRSTSQHRQPEEAAVLDERSLSIQAQENVVATLRNRSEGEAVINAIMSMVDLDNPALTPERLKAAVVTLLNHGILELTWDGKLIYRPG
jgi:hypothetical protein